MPRTYETLLWTGNCSTFSCAVYKSIQNSSKSSVDFRSVAEKLLRTYMNIQASFITVTTTLIIFVFLSLRQGASSSPQARTSECIFYRRGCPIDDEKAIGRLWEISKIDLDTSKNVELLSQLDESVQSHSGGSLGARQVMGRRCCRSCLYIVTEGKRGGRPILSTHSLKSIIDSWLLKCVLFFVEPESSPQYLRLQESSITEEIRMVAKTLRLSCVNIENDCGTVRMLPFSDVRHARKALCGFFKNDTRSKVASVDDCTLQKRIEPSLAGRGIILKKLGYRSRFYVVASQIEQMLSASVKTTSRGFSWTRPTPSNTKSYLQTVAKHFQDSKQKYWGVTGR